MITEWILGKAMSVLDTLEYATDKAHQRCLEIIGDIEGGIKDAQMRIEDFQVSQEAEEDELMAEWEVSQEEEDELGYDRLRTGSESINLVANDEPWANGLDHAGNTCSCTGARTSDEDVSRLQLEVLSRNQIVWKPLVLTLDKHHLLHGGRLDDAPCLKRR